eukprot:TRINITY_DN96181_c0_g1_i1.p1 TRINITY_DN96181_c0_g1~~TRINITY_DN96181_c0_g1_i1.p1  ORF type:complete len:270 (-),score=30.01 TRINITY_DN96181_c0_g1_i1:122-931(-)
MGSSSSCDCSHSHSDSDSDSSDDESQAPVNLNIYDVGHNAKIIKANNVLHLIGTGLFHAGVEVYGKEWSYGKSHGTGVFASKPNSCKAHNFRETVAMGSTRMTEKDVARLVKELMKEWPGPAYDLLRHNCTHFAKEICQRLDVGPVPRWVMNLSAAGATIQGGIVRAKHISQAPFVLAAAKANDFNEMVGDLIEYGAADLADRDAKHQHGKLCHIRHGLVALGKEARGADPKSKYRFGDGLRGVTKLLTSDISKIHKEETESELREGDS